MRISLPSFALFRLFNRYIQTQDRVKVSVTPIFIFLQRDGMCNPYLVCADLWSDIWIVLGTVISIHPNSRGSTDFTSAITMRLHQRDTGLRQSADPSMLVHSILDLSMTILSFTNNLSYDIQ